MPGGGTPDEGTAHPDERLLNGGQDATGGWKAAADGPSVDQHWLWVPSAET